MEVTAESFAATRSARRSLAASKVIPRALDWLRLKRRFDQKHIARANSNSDRVFVSSVPLGDGVRFHGVSIQFSARPLIHEEN